MSEAADHRCQFRQALIWSSWNTIGETREREGRRLARCTICDRARSVRKHRPPTLVEREAIARSATAMSGDVAEIAGALARAGIRRMGAAEPPRFRVRSIVERFGRRGRAASTTEPILERLANSGFFRGGYRLRGTEWVLEYLVLPDPDEVFETVYPGVREEQRQRLENARTSVDGLTHPVARDIQSILLAPDADRFSQRMLRALVAVAHHIETGDVLSANVFSARYLGGAKELRRVRDHLERLLGPLDALGVRDGGALLLVGRAGTVTVGRSAVDLAQARPFLGLPREIVRTATWEFPQDGLLLVENLAAFEAACSGDVPAVSEWMVVWSAGYPSRSVRRVVEEAAGQGRLIRTWADLDLDGIRIARLIIGWAGERSLPWRMSPDDVRIASARRELTARARQAIETDLRQAPSLPLAETLRALLEIDAVIEQEVFVGKRLDLRASAQQPAQG